MKLRLIFFWLTDILGINALFRALNRHKAIILWYHGICEDDFDLLKGYDERHISKSSFKKQLEYLQRKGYSFINMTELVDALKNGQKLNKKVVLTFDDGLKSIVKNAYPIIRNLNVKGCLYLVSDLVGTDYIIWTEYIETVIRNQKQGKYQFSFNGEKITYTLSDKKSYEHAMIDIKAKLRSLPNGQRIEHYKQFEKVESDNIPEEFAIASWEEIMELDPDVIEIGSHTKSHPNCANLTSEEELEKEISLSKKILENKTGQKIDHFCYPAGSYNDEVIDMVKKSGYTSAVITIKGFVNDNPDLYQLTRILPDENFLVFKSRISGSNRMFRKMN